MGFEPIGMGWLIAFLLAFMIWEPISPCNWLLVRLLLFGFQQWHSDIIDDCKSKRYAQ